jgi:hypothetical protein
LSFLFLLIVIKFKLMVLVLILRWFSSYRWSQLQAKERMLATAACTGALSVDWNPENPLRRFGSCELQEELRLRIWRSWNFLNLIFSLTSNK